MNRKSRLIPMLGGLVCLIAVSAALHAAERGVTTDGYAYVSGGIAEEEDLVAQKSRYSLWLTTASKGSGGFLAGARARLVNDRTGQVVLEHVMDGPWLFANLPPGRYRVEASFRESDAAPEQTLRRAVSLKAGDHRQIIMYFDTSDKVRQEVDGPPKVNPYLGK